MEFSVVYSCCVGIYIYKLIIGNIVLNYLASSLGSFLVAVILKPQFNQYSSKFSIKNESYDYARFCGFNNCPDTKLPDISSKSTPNSIYSFIGTMMFLCILSIFCTLMFVDNISLIVDDEIERIPKKSVGKMLKQEFVNLFNLAKSVDFYLLIPVGIYAGFELTFIWTEFNRAFVTCIASVNYVGWTNIVYGLVGSFCSFFFGYIAKYTTRFPVIILVHTASISVGLFVISW